MVIASSNDMSLHLVYFILSMFPLPIPYSIYKAFMLTIPLVGMGKCNLRAASKRCQRTNLIILLVKD